jgi:hypothetical protein
VIDYWSDYCKLNYWSDYCKLNYWVITETKNGTDSNATYRLKKMLSRHKKQFIKKAHIYLIVLNRMLNVFRSRTARCLLRGLHTCLFNPHLTRFWFHKIVTWILFLLGCPANRDLMNNTTTLCWWLRILFISRGMFFFICKKSEKAKKNALIKNSQKCTLTR